MKPSPPFRLRPLALAYREGRAVNAMSVDVEEHFQVQAMAGRVGRDEWDRRDSRVEASTGRVLDLFSVSGIKATFFVLGWVAERHPALIRRIVADGHELASHGYEHVRADSQTPGQFRADILRTKSVLEDIGGVKIAGFRAATFSISRRNLWAYPILEEVGYTYSSSIHPIAHDLYGMADAPRFPFYPSAGSDFIEFPITTLRLNNRNWPFSGGGFFRLFPYVVSRWAIRRVNASENQAAVFYFHPWEVDADQPREPGLPLKSRVRHYLNLSRVEPRLERLAQDFAWDRIGALLGAGS